MAILREIDSYCIIHHMYSPMQISTFSRRLSIALLAFGIVVGSISMRAQTAIALPDGETVVAVNVIHNIIPGVDVRFCATKSRAYVTGSPTGSWQPNTLFFDTIPMDRRIVDACVREGENGPVRTYALLLDNGDVIALRLNFISKTMDTPPQLIPSPFVPGTNGFNQLTYKKVLYSNILAIQYGTQVYINTLDGSPYKLDSVMTKSSSINDINFDHNAALIASTTKGLFVFAQDSLRWKRTMGLDTTMSTVSFFDAADGRLFVGTSSNGPYLSTDAGNTWSRDTAGIGKTALLRFAKDSNNTVYAFSTSTSAGTSNLYAKHTGAAWMRIDTALTVLSGSQVVINDIASGNSLEVATKYGIMTSANSGVNFSNSTKNIKAEDIYGLEFVGNGAEVVSTVCGMFRTSDTTWTQVYPTTGFDGAHTLYRANTPSLLSFQLTPKTAKSIAPIMSSSDQGQSWYADTTGLSHVSPPSGFVPATYFMDSFGRMFISENTPVSLYSTPGWSLDTAGFNWPNISGTGSALTVVSDPANTTYFSGGIFTNGQNGFVPKQPLLYRRSAGTTTWQADTSGLGTNVLSCICFDGSNTYGASTMVNGSSSFYQHDANGWQKLPSTPIAISDASAMGVDSAHTIYIAYSATISGGAANQGIVATSDKGTTWQSAGLRGATIRGVRSTATATYAFTARGAYKLQLSALRVPNMVFSKHVIDFDTVSIGLSKDTTVTINNSGTDTLVVSNLRPNNANFLVSPNSFSIAPGASKDITVSFAPQSGGLTSTTLRPVANTAPDTMYLVGFSKSANAVLFYDDQYVDLGSVTVGTSRDTVVSIQNLGTDAAVVQSVKSDNADVSATPQAFQIPAKGKYDITIHYAPSKEGSLVTHLHFASNSPAYSLQILANGLTASVDDPQLADAIGLKLLPNPVTSTNASLTCSFAGSTRLCLDLVNEQGRQLTTWPEQTVNAGPWQLDLSSALQSQPNGVYMLRLTSDKGSCSVKLVLNR